MDLNQQSLRGILAAITSVDQNYIVPKQGNWWNPQEALQKPDTWCAYIIRSNRPRTVPFYHVANINGQKINGAVVEKIADIDLQFVGPQSEEIAQSVAFWPFRSDVEEQFKAVHGAVMNDGMEAISSPFYQDGNNTVMAWNVTFRVIWYQIIDTSQGVMPATTVNGHINT